MLIFIETFDKTSLYWWKIFRQFICCLFQFVTKVSILLEIDNTV